MILYVICQLVCVIDSWAHTSFVHSILSLKLGVTAAGQTAPTNAHEPPLQSLSVAVNVICGKPNSLANNKKPYQPYNFFMFSKF